MKINTLRLENFQGIKTAAFNFDGQSASIYGDNATGKTTVFNSVTWLLLDRPSTGARSYTPKTCDPYGGGVHYLDHSAEAVFSMEDGRLVTLKKVFHETYKRRRGSATEEFSGHRVDFYIDGVPVKEKDYKDSLLAICGGSEKMKMLTMPNYFPEEMTWDARRKILLEICGDVSDEDVISAAGGLEELRDYLLMPGTTNQHYTVDDYKRIAAAKKTDINRELQSIPGRIDEAQRAIPEIACTTAAIDKKLAELAAQQEQLTAKKAAVLSGGTAAAEARQRTAAAEAAIAEARSAYILKTSAANQDIQNAINALQPQLNEAFKQYGQARGEADLLLHSAERMESRRQELLDEYSRVRAETWDEGRSICPTCHRLLPEDEVAKMRADFNEKRSSRLQAINERGQMEASQTMIEEVRAKAAQLQMRAEAASQLHDSLLHERYTMTKKLQTPPPFESTEEYSRLAAAAAEARAQEANAGKCTQSALETINRQLQAVREEAQAFQQQRGQAELLIAQKRRIAELKTQEKELSAQYETLERGIYLCDQFTKSKIRRLTDQINNRFQNVRFRLFVEQVNGGVRDDCEVLVPSDNGTLVPFRDANNAARVNAGLEIIAALSDHWQISMPVFIDNAESVTHLIDTTMQTVRLVVSEPDCKLRLVLDETRM